MAATTVENKAQAEAGLSHALKTLFAVAENYPTLRANENFMSLQNTLTHIEDEVQLARRYYNGTVRNYMSTMQSFPTSIVASFGNFQKASYFELTTAEQRDVPHVKF